MKREEISDALGLLPDDMIREAEHVRQNPKKRRRWPKWVALAACLCLVLAGGVHTLYRFDYLLAACGAYPGTIVDGVYYYRVPHSGVWSYTPEGGSQKLLSTYWIEDTWQVNEYGIYYWQGLSLYVCDHETGQRQKLYSASRSDCTHIRFSLCQDGNVIFIGYNRDTRVRFELLLDGKTGDVLETVMEPTSYDDLAIAYSNAHVTVGDRELQLVPIGDEDERLFGLTENGESILPEGMGVTQYAKHYFGDNVWLIGGRLGEGWNGATVPFVVLRPDGNDEILTLPDKNYCGGTNDYLFYSEYTELDYSVRCLEIATGKTWELVRDAECTIYAFTTDGTYLYSSVPWGETQACWKLEYGSDGKPAGLTLISGDIQSDRTP